MDLDHEAKRANLWSLQISKKLELTCGGYFEFW